MKTAEWHTNALPLTRRPSTGGNGVSGVHDQLVIVKEKCDRLSQENADLSRRIKEKDDRVTELQKNLATAQQRGNKATEQLIAEQTERKAVDNSLKKATVEREHISQSLADAVARADRAEASASSLQGQCDAATAMANQMTAALERAQHDAHLAAEQAARSDAAVSEMKAEMLRKETHEREKLETVEAQREAARAETTQLTEKLAVAVTESRLREEGIKQMNQLIEDEVRSVSPLSPWPSPWS